MSMWNVDLEGFPPQWLDVAGRFEDGHSTVLLRCADERAAMRLRFEWYAFKRKLRATEISRGADRLYPALPRVTAEVGQLRSGEWAVRLRLRDLNKSAAALSAALALTPEEVEALDAEFDAVADGGQEDA